MGKPYDKPEDALLVEGPIDNIKVQEVKKALKEMKKGKAGPSELSVEMAKVLGEAGEGYVHALLQKIWVEEPIPEDWK